MKGSILVSIIFLLSTTSLFGQTLDSIPSPSGFDNTNAGLQRNWDGPTVVYNSNMYLRYKGNDDNYDLYRFDGTTLTQIPSPSGYNGANRGLNKFSFEYQGDLYLRYQNNSGNYLLFRFDGTTLTPIPSPAGYTDNIRGYVGTPIEYLGDMYVTYQGNDLNRDLFRFDGTTLTAINSPAGYDAGASGCYGNPIVMQGKLYLLYLGNSSGNRRLAQYDGTSLTILSNPVGFDDPSRGYWGKGILYNGIVSMQYRDNSGTFHLMTYNGVAFNVIPTPVGYVGSNFGYQSDPIVYGSSLYMRYRGTDSNYDLFRFDGTSLTEISSPTGFNAGVGSSGYWKNPIEHDGNLFLWYISDSEVYSLFKYDGTILTEISNLPGYSNTWSGYRGERIVFDSKLYLQYQDDLLINHLFEYDAVGGLNEITSPVGFDGEYKGLEHMHAAFDGNLYLRYKGNDDNYDLFKLSPCIETAGTDVQIACDSYTWTDGNTYTSDNSTATDTLVNVAGCDSIVTLNLTITNSTTGTDVQTACDSYLWIDGVTYTSDNTSATYVLTNAAGCDSTVTLNLTITNSTSGVDVQTACDSYLWIDGMTYTSSNTGATHVLTNAAGCDSTVTLNLTITNSTTGIDVQTACDSYLWIDGMTYTSGNTSATHVLTNALGCDSTVTLNLTISNSTTGTDIQTACVSYTWIDGMTYTSDNNSATHVLTNAAGCDSTITLNLTITQVNTNVTITEPILSADAVGATYQWLECPTLNSLSGETNQILMPSTNGEYAVEVTENGCVDTSSCYAINTIGVDKTSDNMNYVIYPNPNTGQFQIRDLTNGHQNIDVYVLSSSGEQVAFFKNIEDGFQFDLSQLASGIYALRLVGEIKERILRLVLR